MNTAVENKIMEFRYIFSGLSQFNRSSFLNSEEYGPRYKEGLRNLLKSIDSVFPNINFGFLFNAYVERKVGESFCSVFKGDYEIHSDSGGLQVFTLGKDIDEKEKDKIFRNQAKYSDIGYSFDSIPIKIVNSGRSGRTGTKTKVFDPSLIKECAKRSGKDLLRQMEIYEEESSNCKPFLIIHGSDIQTYQMFVDYALEEIPHSLWDNIGGICSGAGALGFGIKEDVERIFILSQLQLPPKMSKRFHILGIGSCIRMIPVFQFKKSGLFSEDVHFSFDSTRHTSMSYYGGVIVDSKEYRMKRAKTKNYLMAFELFSKACKEIFNYEITEEFFYDVFIDSPQKKDQMIWKNDEKKSMEKGLEIILTQFAYALFNAIQEFRTLEKFVKEEENIMKDINTYNALSFLSKVTGKESFEEWKRIYSRYLTSRPVKEKIDSILSFFDQEPSFIDDSLMVI